MNFLKSRVYCTRTWNLWFFFHLVLSLLKVNLWKWKHHSLSENIAIFHTNGYVFTQYLFSNKKSVIWWLLHHDLRAREWEEEGTTNSASRTKWKFVHKKLNNFLFVIVFVEQLYRKTQIRFQNIFVLVWLVCTSWDGKLFLAIFVLIIVCIHITCLDSWIMHYSFSTTAIHIM